MRQRGGSEGRTKLVGIKRMRRLGKRDLLVVGTKRILLLTVISLAGEGFPGGTSDKEPTCQCRRHESWVRSLGWEDPLEEGMATHSSILA